jgi:hypothetical protein
MAEVPAIVWFVGGTVTDAMATTGRMYEITLAEHPLFQVPALDFRGTPAGIDTTLVARTGILPQINTGPAGKVAGTGQVGAGLVTSRPRCARWPERPGEVPDASGCGQAKRKTGPRGAKGRTAPAGIRKACSRRILTRSHPASVMTRMGPSFGKSGAVSSRSTPGWRTVPPRPRTLTRPAMSNGSIQPLSCASASQKTTRTAGTSRETA